MGARDRGSSVCRGSSLQNPAQQLRHRLQGGAAGVEQLHLGRAQGLPVMAVQLLRGDRRHIRSISQPGNPEAVLPAHGPEHLSLGIDPLVIEGGLYGADEIFLLPLHIAGIQGPLHQPGAEEHLSQQLRHGLQNPVSL